MNQMKSWWESASLDEQRRLALLAGTTVGTLQQIVGSYRTQGHPSVRSGLAGRIANGAETLRKRNAKLPRLVRTDLSHECRSCEYAQRCLKNAAVASDFDSIDDYASLL